MSSHLLILFGLGRIISDLPNQYVLDSNTPDNLPDSNIVLANPTPEHSQHFYAGIINIEQHFILATYDLQYILQVSGENSKGYSLLKYEPVKSPLVQRGDVPSWITDNMLFTIVYSCDDSKGTLKISPVSEPG